MFRTIKSLKIAFYSRMMREFLEGTEKELYELGKDVHDSKELAVLTASTPKWGDMW